MQEHGPALSDSGSVQVDVLSEAERLRGEHVPFVLATVVVAQHPTSGTLGARAIVTSDGKLSGWIGGSCADTTVVRESLHALAEGSPRLLVLSPHASAPATPRPGVVELPMTCASQGELQIFIEPFLPKAELVVIGASPVAKTLAHLGALLDFEVCACDPDASADDFPGAHRFVSDPAALAGEISERSFVVVATVGRYDEDALLAVVTSPAAYVGLVASLKRFAAVLDYLRDHGVDEEHLARIKRPEGLPGKTLVPAEIAFSTMAALLQARRESTTWAPPAEPANTQAMDPICGMPVDITTARHTSVRDGVTSYFCAAGCKAKFEAA